MLPPINRETDVPVKVGLVAPAKSGSPSTTDEELRDSNVSLPPGLHPVTLTVEEAEAIRKKLNDPDQRTYEGKDLPKADASVLRNKKA